MDEDSAGMQNARDLSQHVPPAGNEMKHVHSEHGVEAPPSEGELCSIGLHHIDTDTAALGE
jgi:hypothetical protein